MTSVVHWRQEPYDVYIGRPSIWGNPYVPGIDGTRRDCLRLYRDYILSTPELFELLPTLVGKRLGCWCKPSSCHGDILVELIEEYLNNATSFS